MKNIEHKTTLMKYIELREDSSIEELLYNMYIKEKMSIREIAEKLDIHYHTVNSWLDEIGIKKRLPHEMLLEVMSIRRKLERGNKNE